MKRLILTLACVFLFSDTSVCYGTIVSWEASSGLLPSDLSIPVDQRFVLSGNLAWLSLTSELLNIQDKSSTYQLNFKNHNTLPDAQSDWMYQIELRMNSHARPNWNFGATTGFTINGRRIFLAIAKDQIGFIGNDAFLNGKTYSIDTTNGFHLYKVTNESDSVNLYIDGSTLPALSIPYMDFPVISDNGTAVDLVQTSNPGVADFDIQSFTYNTNGISPVPEPATMLLLGSGLIGLAGFRKKFRKKIQPTTDNGPQTIGITFGVGPR